MKQACALLTLLGAACVDPTPDVETTEQGSLGRGKAVRLGGVAYVDTDAVFSKFWDEPFTITAWINPEFAYSYIGPIFASSETTAFSVGMGDYREGPGGYKTAGPPVLTVVVNGKRLNYPAPELMKRQWNHLALVRTAPDDAGEVTYQLWVNGERLTPMAFNDDNLIVGIFADHKEPAGDLTVPDGWLRLGRSPDMNEKDDRHDQHQFYGMVDDVTVFDGAFSKDQVADAAANYDLGLPPRKYQYGFNEDGTGSSYDDGYVLFADAVRVPIDGGAFDSFLIFDSTEYTTPTIQDYVLPFPKAEEWKVLQGVDEPGGTHNGSAAWCWDFIRADDDTAFAPVTSPADGDVYKVWEGHDGQDGENEGNSVRISHIFGWEATRSLHLYHESFSMIFLQYDGTPLPDKDDPATWIPIQQGDYDGLVGPNANHLHFGMLPGHEATQTRPMAFVDYEASDDEGATWYPVARGMPRRGQWLRH